MRVWPNIRKDSLLDQQELATNHLTIEPFRYLKLMARLLRGGKRLQAGFQLVRGGSILKKLGEGSLAKPPNRGFLFEREFHPLSQNSVLGVRNAIGCGEGFGSGDGTRAAVRPRIGFFWNRNFTIRAPETGHRGAGEV